jgi:hypothetical protein
MEYLAIPAAIFFVGRISRTGTSQQARAQDLGEHVTLQLRAEFFNILNHPNFTGINNNLAGSNPGSPHLLPILGLRIPFSGAEVHVTFNWGPKFVW